MSLTAPGTEPPGLPPWTPTDRSIRRDDRRDGDRFPPSRTRMESPASQEGTDHYAPRIGAPLFLPLEHEQVAQRIAEAAGEAWFIDPVVDLHVHRLYPKDPGHQEERQGHARTVANYQIGPVTPEHPPGQPEVPQQIEDAPRV